MDQGSNGFYQGVTETLCEWVFYYAKNKTVWKDKNGISWSIEERRELGGDPLTPPDFPQGFEYIANLLFRLRDFCGSIENPITPMLVSSLGEYVSDIDRDIIYEMDKAFRKGASEAQEHWKDK